MTENKTAAVCVYLGSVCFEILSVVKDKFRLTPIQINFILH
jgi:hypothetical protein